MVKFLIGIGIPPSSAGDVGLILEIILLGIALLFLAKKTKVGAFGYAIYAGYFVVDKLENIFSFSGAMMKGGALFLVALVLHHGLFRWTVKVKLGGSGLVRWIKRLVISFSVTGFLFSVVMSWMSPKELNDMSLSDTMSNIFLSDLSGLIWALVPLMVIFILRKRDQ